MNIDQNNPAAEENNLASQDAALEAESELDPSEVEVDALTYSHAGTPAVPPRSERWLVTYTIEPEPTDEERRMAAELADEEGDGEFDPEDDGDEDGDGEDDGDEEGDGPEFDPEEDADDNEDDGEFDGDETDDETADDEGDELRQSAGPYYGDSHSVFVDMPAGLLPSEVELIFEREAVNIPDLIPEGYVLVDFAAYYIVTEKVVDMSKAAVPNYDEVDDEDESLDGDDEDQPA